MIIHLMGQHVEDEKLLSEYLSDSDFGYLEHAFNTISNQLGTSMDKGSIWGP